MTRPVGLLHADRLALLECRHLTIIHSRTAAASLRAKGLVVHHGYEHGSAHHLTEDGLAVVAQVEDEAAGDKVARATALHPGTRFRTHLDDPPLTVHRIDSGPDPYEIGRPVRVHTREPWPVAGDPDRRWRDIDLLAPILLVPDDDWTLSGQMELPI